VITVPANGIAVHALQMAPNDAGTAEAPAEAPTVVMIHGLGTDSMASWYFTLGKPFADAGLRVVMYDLRGHGHSERPATGYQVDDFVDDLEDLLPQMGVDGRVFLLGNSFGGTIAFAYAMRHPDRTAGIAVIESEPATEAWATKMAANLDRAATQLPRPAAQAWIALNRGRRTARLAKAAGQMLSTTTLARDIPASRLLSRAEIATIACPVLCIYGADSDLAEQAVVMEATLPRCRTVMVPRQKHSVLVEQPDTVREQFFSWLRQDCADRHEQV